MILRQASNPKLNNLVGMNFRQGAIDQNGFTYFHATNNTELAFRTKIRAAQLAGSMYRIQTVNSVYVFEILPGEFLDTRYLNNSLWECEKHA